MILSTLLSSAIGLIYEVGNLNYTVVFNMWYWFYMVVARTFWFFSSDDYLCCQTVPEILTTQPGLLDVMGF